MNERLEVVEEIRNRAKDLLYPISKYYYIYFITSSDQYEYLDTPKLTDDILIAV